MPDDDAAASDRSRQNQRGGRSLAEWATFVLSLVIVAGFIGVAFFEYFSRREGDGPRLRVEVMTNQTEQRGNRYYVPYRVWNDGAASARDVTLIVEIVEGGAVREMSSAQLALLPVGGAERGEIVTALDPTRYQVTARIGTLQLP